MLMLQVLLLTLALLTPPPGLSGLASPRFAVREQASRDLLSRMTWPVAVRLSLCPPMELEARRRVALALDEYWRVWPVSGKWPRLDFASDGRVHGPDPFWLRYYKRGLERQHRLNSFLLRGHETIYNAATELLISDLRELLVPPSIIRAVLSEWERRERLWQNNQPAIPNRMPQTAEPPQAVRP